MSYEDLVEEEPETEVLFLGPGDMSSEEPPMSEWSSLVIKVWEDNVKKEQYEQGLYDPGSGEICTAYVTQSDSAVLRHPYYDYPGVTDPGIMNALLRPPPDVFYPSDGQEHYLALCKVMNQCPVRKFHRNLLNEHINLSYYGVNPNGVRAMAIALERNTIVTHLNLTDNWLNDDGCFHLGQMLGNNYTLTHLNLNGCRIRYSGVRRLYEGLVTNRSLRVLNLGRNLIGDEGVNQIAQAIKHRSNICELDLSRNEISGKGCQYLAEALEMQNKISSLNLSHNNLYSFPSGICNLLDLLGENFQYLNLAWNSLSGLKIASSIKNVFSCKLLRHVDLNNNKFCEKPVITKLIAWFAKPKNMRCFDLSYNPLSLTDAQLVIEKFKNSAILELNLEGINVTNKFKDVQRDIEKRRNNVAVKHGYVHGGVTPTVVDQRDIVLRRADFIAKKNKKRQVDIALVVLELLKDNVTAIEPNHFNYAMKRLGAVLDEDLISGMMALWPGEPTKKGAKRIDLNAMAEFIKRKWPDRKLPPTPPPETEIVEKSEKKGKKKIGKTPAH